MFNLKNEALALTERVKELTDQKWNAIDNSMKVTRKVNTRMFEEALIVLSGIEGKLKFAVGGKSWDESKKNIECDFTRDVVEEAKEGINNVRRSISDIMKELRDGIDQPLNSSVSKTLAEIE